MFILIWVSVLIHCACCGCRLGVYCLHASVIVQVCKLMAGLMVGMLPLCPRCGGGPMPAQRFRHWTASTTQPPQCFSFFCWDCCVVVNKPAWPAEGYRYNVGLTISALGRHCPGIDLVNNFICCRVARLASPLPSKQT